MRKIFVCGSSCWIKKKTKNVLNLDQIKEENYNNKKIFYKKNEIAISELNNRNTNKNLLNASSKK